MSDSTVRPAGVSVRSVDAVIVGAGFAGTYMAHRLTERGLNAVVIEAGDGPGGTWYWNRYPGARCDIESLEYSYQFSDALQQEWTWSERYATQPELLRYIEHVVDRFDLRRHMRFGERVLAARYREDDGRWQVTTDQDMTFECRFVVMATGCLSSANLPAIDGLSDFAGSWYHTGHWPHEGVDFTGQRVAVVGTGSSGIQSIPLIAEQAAQLTVFQRTPNYSVPAHNGPIPEPRVKAIKARYDEFRAANRETAFHADFAYGEANALEQTPEALTREYEARWARGGLPFMAAFADLLFDTDANETAAAFLRGKIRDLVDDPETAERLSPRTVVGCKRLCVDTNYYATFNRDNVALVDVSDGGVERIDERAILAGGKRYDVDAIVFATGFDAMTGAMTKIEIEGRGGVKLTDAWAEGPKTYLGLAVHGFPNLFTVTGPGSPSVLTNMLPSIEHHVEWIDDCIGHVLAQQAIAIEAGAPAQEEWVAHVNEVGDASLYPRCNSWYLGANVPGKPRVFMPYLGFPPYAERCAEVVANGYEGFELTG
jgi:cyclohexanone monooxygenase